MKFNKWTLGLAAVGAVSLSRAVRAHADLLANVVKAHETTGHVSLHEHAGKMQAAVHKAIQTDARFNTPKAVPAGEVSSSYKPKPYCLDITTTDENGQHHAIINTADGRLVRHGFDFNHDEGTCELVSGESKPTESTRVYATEIERMTNIIQATENVVSCRASGGTKIAPSEPWVEGKAVNFIYAPAGVTTISAGFRKNESITCSVMVDEDTAKDLQASFDFIVATEKQEPFADEDHESRKATLRFPEGTKFVFGTHRGEEGIIVQGAQPTSYGAEVVNGKVYASWSPEFALDADYAKAKCKKGHWTFPDGVRGSASNPARMVAVNFVTGALTNKPAFKNMPKVKAKDAAQHEDSPWTRYIVAAHEKDTVTLNDLQNAVCVAAESDKRFKPENDGKKTDELCSSCWCCDIILDADVNKWLAIIRACNGKMYQVSFTINKDSGKPILGTGEKEVTRKTEYIEACDRSEFSVNSDGETLELRAAVIKAGAPAGNNNAAKDHAAIIKEYKDNQEHNYHSENAHLLAKHFGHPEEAEIGKHFIALHKRLGEATKSGVAFQGEMSQKYYKHIAPTAQATEHADPLAEQLDVICARQFGDKAVLDAIAGRVPAVAHRDALDKILAHQTVTATADPKPKPALSAAELAKDEVLNQIFARMGVNA